MEVTGGDKKGKGQPALFTVSARDSSENNDSSLN